MYNYQSVSGVEPDPVIPSVVEKEESDTLVLVLGSVFAVISLILAIFVVFLYRRHLILKSKVSHENIRSSPSVKNNCVQNIGYQGSVGYNLIRPETAGRGAPQSIGHSGSVGEAGRPSSARKDVVENERPSTGMTKDFPENAFLVHISSFFCQLFRTVK